MRFLRAAFLSFCLIAVAHGQLSFFSPPAYSGGNTLFTFDLNNDGKADLISRGGQIQLGNGDGTFTDAGTSPVNVAAVADFNGDGKLDIVAHINNTLVVLLGKGDGTFGNQITTTVGVPMDVIAADVNGDGKADIVGNSSQTIFIELSNGDGTFSPGATYTLPSAPGYPLVNFEGLIAADLNKDNIIDLVTPSEVYLGNGNGTFQALTLNAPGGAYQISVVDFDGDTNPDLVMKSATWLYLLLGNGDGTFQSAATLLDLSEIDTVAPGCCGDYSIADFDNDGKLDVAVFAPPFVQTYLGNGNSTFSAAKTFFTKAGSPASSGLVVSDFNNDGKLDVAAGNFILLGKGDGTFQANPGFLNPAPGAISATGDFNNDGSTDFATIAYTPATSTLSTVNVLLSDKSGSFKVASPYALAGTGDAKALLAGDWNHDGNMDLAVISAATTNPNQSSWVLAIFLGNGSGAFSGSSFPLGTVPAATSSGGGQSAVAADFNNDGFLDIAVAEVSGNMAVLLGNGDGTFNSPLEVPDANAAALVAADLNGDGVVDVAASQLTASPFQTALLFGKGDGSFNAPAFPLGDFAATFTADANQDGKPDLLGSTSTGMAVLLGKGDGTFTQAWTEANNPPTKIQTPLALQDLDGDGKPDLIYSDGDANATDTGVLLGGGDGTFAPGVSFATAFANEFSEYFVAAMDVNQDGKPDMVFTSSALLNTTQPITPSLGLSVMAGSPSSLTVTAGSSATFSFSVGGKGFTGQVTLSCSGLPSTATCTFPDGSTQIVSGAVPSSFSVVVGTTARTASLHPPSRLGPTFIPVFALLAVVFVPASGASTRIRKHRRQALLLIGLAVLIVCCSCGGGTSTSNPPPGGSTKGTAAGTYTVTVTATAGSLSQSVPVTLTVP